jgi:oligopeptide/dipeptide ABC transporter ATP-binding protein
VTPSSTHGEPLLAVQGLRVSSSRGEILRGVDLLVGRGEVVGIVGESGCGKTTLGMAVLGLLGRTRWISEGNIRLSGELFGAAAAGGAGSRGWLGTRLSFVPQDPFRAFDPLRRMGPQVRRPLELHRHLTPREADERVADLLARLGVTRPETVMERYPHQLSGGLLQRAAIATALSCGPELVIADEPTTALDALVQVQVIESFRRLVQELGTSLVVISHDLRLLERMADRIAAMYAGRIVEFGTTERMLRAPRHPYTAALLASSVLSVEPGQHVPTIDGQPPSLPGTFAPCAFAPRCPRADERCLSETPAYAWPAVEGEACHHPITGPRSAAASNHVAHRSVDASSAGPRSDASAGPGAAA